MIRGQSFGIFTACFDGYERWLADWEASIAEMRPPPDEAFVIGDEAARRAWRGIGTFVLAPEFGNPYRQAASYNRVVSEMRSEWIMHLGVDDLVFPRLLPQIAALTYRADVIACDVSVERGGKVTRIRRNRPTAEALLRPTMGGQALDACAAYRRKFWERARYNEEIIGGSDVALWIGFAKIGARFTGTRIPGVRYRLHADSLWHRRTPENIAAVRSALNALRLNGHELKPLPPAPTREREFKLSVVIMAHRRRAHFVKEILSRLDGTPTVVWDERSDRWDTGRRSLLAFDPDATHHLVIQDDALVSRDLIAGLREALAVRPNNPVSLYLGRQRPHAHMFESAVKDAERKRSSWIVGRELCWGVGLCFPTRLIPPMVEWCDRKVHVSNYDRRLSVWLEAQRIPIYYTVPSLVDHRRERENPSLVPGRRGASRVAHRFIGLDRSAIGLDWHTEPVIIP